MEKDQIARIQHMEEHLCRISAAQAALRQALDAYRTEQDALRELTAWYESPLWRADYEADEAGLLPRDLKRGVLSEDGIYNVLAEDTALRDALRCFPDDLEEWEGAIDAETEESDAC